jgi:hypothetical protein
MNAGPWAYEVEIETSRETFDGKLRAIEAWLNEWEIPHQIGSTLMAKGVLRVCFADERFARAFLYHQGGRRVPADQIAAALKADADDEAEYDRLARECSG